MVNKIKLSQRLQTVASFIPEGSFFVDIGSDHAYLPCFICLHDKNARAIAGEISKGPYNRAVKTVNMYSLTDVIDIRLGDGLSIIDDEEISEVVIAGMGGSLITAILEEGQTKLATVRRIIVQPNVEARHVRKWLLDHDYKLINEVIVEENNHFYEVLVADKYNVHDVYDNKKIEQQLLFGPFLLKEKSPLFIKKWQHEAEKLHNVIRQMKRAKNVNQTKISQFEQRLHWIQEVTRKNEKNC